MHNITPLVWYLKSNRVFKTTTWYDFYVMLFKSSYVESGRRFDSFITRKMRMEEGTHQVFTVDALLGTMIARCTLSYYKSIITPSGGPTKYS